MSDRRQRRSEGWAAHLDPQRVRHEKQLAAITGQYPTIHCDTKHDQLVVSFDRPPHPAYIERVADSLASLWPGLLAPAGVELVVVNGDTWDAEAMALRFHQRRTIG